MFLFIQTSCGIKWVERTLAWFEISCFFFHPSVPLHTGLLVDIFDDYKYLFFLCGSVTVTGGLFLFVMNIYNYHMLEKENTAKDREQNLENIENQDQASFSEVGMRETSEATMEGTEPGAKEKN